MSSELMRCLQFDLVLLVALPRPKLALLMSAIYGEYCIIEAPESFYNAWNAWYTGQVP